MLENAAVVRRKNILTTAECLYDLAAIEAALDTMAASMTPALKDSYPLILCVMMGALVTVGQLLPRLGFPLEVGYLHVTRYHGTTEGSDLHWLVEPRQSLQDRTVVIIDDVMDSGLTLNAIRDYCHQAGAAQVYIAVLVNKRAPRGQGVQFVPDFIALHTDARYLVGFGLDYEEYWRNAPGIYALNETSLVAK